MIKLIITTVLTLIWNFSKSIEVETGEGSIYSVKQDINIGYINIREDATIYYQYFKSLEESANKHLTFFVGYNVSVSAQGYAFMGYLPYTILRTKNDKIGVEVIYNTKSLNKLTDIVTVDIVRGGGFSSNLEDVKVDFDLIEKDLGDFIKIFRNTYKIPEDKITTIYACYELVTPVVNYAKNSKTRVDLILQNPWLGYTSFSQLYYELPAYGVTDRKGLDMISNKIYRLMSSDYGKDLDDMSEGLDKMRNYLLNDIPVDCHNPNVDQSWVKKFKEGYNYFLEECKTCRAYCSLQKENWNNNSTLRDMMKKDLVFDHSEDLFNSL